MRELFAFFGSRYLGVFQERDGIVTFTYSDDPGTTPLSISLPIDGSAEPGAAYAYLDNLLPDRKVVRERWARERSTGGDDPLSLLVAYGEDVAGAVTLAADRDWALRHAEPVIEATEDDIAFRIASLAKDDTNWLDPQVRPRMSVAGNQGKFTLARVGDRWFWSTYAQPSTHILKPPPTHHPNVDVIEAAALSLARDIGIEASRAEVIEFVGQPTYMIERWDRFNGVRLHAEDVNQALGSCVARKYSVTAAEVTGLLGTYQQVDRFVQQLAFNVAIGNADAHAKNYSILLAGDQAELAPLYDAIPTHLWPQYNRELAMRIGNALTADRVTETNWRLFAAESGLDEEHICELALPIVAAVADRFDDTFGPLAANSTQQRAVAKWSRVLNRT